MKTLKKIIIGLVALAAIFWLAMIIIAPSVAKLEKSTTINVAPEIAFEQVNNLTKWNNWSPWYKLDPNATWEFSEQIRGADAWYSWKGNSDVGEGKLTHTKVEEFTRIEDNMDFGPMGSANAWFTFEPDGEGTKVTWGFVGEEAGLHPMKRMGNLFIPGALGPQYEEGMANLKEVCEALPPLPNIEVEIRTADPKPAYTLRKTVNMSNISEEMGPMFGEIMAHMAAQGNEADGMPWAIWHTFAPGVEEADLEVGITTTGKPTGNGSVKASQTPSGKMISTVYKGPYDGMEGTYTNLKAYMEVMGLEASGPPWEHYLNDPGEVSGPEEYLTQINFPLK